LQGGCGRGLHQECGKTVPRYRPTANILGVPLATWVGQFLGWNAAFVLVAAAALTTAGLARLCLPSMPAHALASPMESIQNRGVLIWLGRVRAHGTRVGWCQSWCGV